MVIGLTAIVPGISFGTMAMLFNIYEKAMDAFSFDSFRKNLSFTIPFFIGILCGIFAFSSAIKYLVTTHDIITYFAFIGLIAGCVPMIYRRAKIEKIKFWNVAVFIIALAGTIFLAYANDNQLANKTLEQLGGLTPSLALWIFFTGIVCAFAIIVPGMSGSIIMLMLGTYMVCVEAVSTFNLAVLAPFVLGIGLGILGGSKIIKTLLQRFHQLLYCIILGFVVGSIAIIYPGFMANLTGAIAIIFAVAFGLISYFFSKKE